jgi:type IV fimbrial biogenesis protein FimT
MKTICPGHRQPKGSAGFTILELLMVLVIGGVLLTLAMPSMKTFVLSQRTKTASFDVFATLTFAHSEAIKRNGDVTITPSGGWQNGWTVTDANNNVLKRQPALKGLTITGPTTVVYQKDGHLSTAVTTPFAVDPSPSVASIPSRCIKIDLSGRPTSYTKSGGC